MSAPPGPVTIAHVDAESGFSGGEVQVFLLIEGLRRRGFDCVLFCPPGSACAERGRARGFDVRTVAMRNDLDGPAVLALRRGFVKCGARLVHLHTGRATWLGGWAARLAGLPAITTRRMDRDVPRSARTQLVYGSLTRATVAISPAVARALEAGGVAPGRIRMIPSAVDAQALAPARERAAVRTELGAGGGELVLLALGALVPRKGLDVLLAALARLAERGLRPQAWIAGDGPERAGLERRAAELGLAPRFLGARTDATDLLGACDVFVMPSRREGLGVAALEAMALARPVVASRVGGLGEAVVDGRTGLLVPPDDAEALARALERVLVDADLRERLGRAGPGRIAEGFQAEQMVAAYSDLYREVLQEAPVP